MEWQGFWHRYFDLNRNYAAIRAAVPKQDAARFFVKKRGKKLLLGQTSACPNTSPLQRGQRKEADIECARTQALQPSFLNSQLRMSLYTSSRFVSLSISCRPSL